VLVVTEAMARLTGQRRIVKWKQKRMITWQRGSVLFAVSRPGKKNYEFKNIYSDTDPNSETVFSSVM
jgi:hypothetical protein